MILVSFYPLMLMVVFKEGASPLIFKTDFDKNVRVFCAEAFKTLICDTGLSGLTFSTDLK